MRRVLGSGKVLHILSVFGGRVVFERLSGTAAQQRNDPTRSAARERNATHPDDENTTTGDDDDNATTDDDNTTTDDDITTTDDDSRATQRKQSRQR